ncbi:hypothetical protein DNTS_021386 [Danionella cerebrum]|uniref:long-chain-fatty-acid--CoA ligase n=1 Tax=Danionella cerebrum TaxID=2873325 RepID=A0A553R0Y8_9TELE|nr:hypothetical protein DNTS_021386 [Danionella translucida]TRY95850.1 hypothetical protein DNTS_021386 [Danionella translucida]
MSADENLPQGNTQNTAVSSTEGSDEYQTVALHDSKNHPNGSCTSSTEREREREREGGSSALNCFRSEISQISLEFLINALYKLSIMSSVCPCCADAVEDQGVIPLTTSAGDVRLAEAQELWSTVSHQGVRLRIGESEQDSQPPITIHQMFKATVEKFGDFPALREKKDGSWVTLTYREYYECARAAAKSFMKLGLERFHGVGILGFNSPEWFIADVGCIFAGGLATGIYTTNSPEACQYVAQNCEANVLVVENHKQLIKILQVRDQLPHLKAIIQYKGELEQKLPNLYTWAEFMKLGETVPDTELDVLIDSQKANECCTLIYTSGTTGNPKGVMLSHDNITWTASAAGHMINLEMGKEEVGSLANTLREVRPTNFLGVPRVWEKMQEAMKAVGAKSSVMKKRIADWAKAIGLEASYNAMNGDLSVPWGFTLANALVFKNVRKALGLDRCKGCFTGAAPITKDTLEYFMSLHIPIYELYGMSESTGPHTISWPQAYRIMRSGALYQPETDYHNAVLK